MSAPILFVQERALWQLSEQCGFVVLEEEPTRFQEMLQSLVELCVAQALNSQSEISGSEETVEARKVYVKKMEALT